MLHSDVDRKVELLQGDWPQVTGTDSSQQQGAEIHNGGLVKAQKRIHNDMFNNALPACQRSRAK